ncbi:Proteins of 100 residues with WXG [Saccharopolyspora antimicrobica]|uniref:Proteins of 100 residues with WXG n=1 Tax=Saccharopolyspora antimicrobica TaxID=455193 RepID=A0A1I4U693_9PSEU|nr:WXG100 family type VII secretion target [Saccharopolyspora antimicrobica]RKT88700.1 type VII secretion system (Wss) protein ESAT-6 [Saccharopolyspora antimicrobica]SFM84405.1 Proteins of 100 residues with WXG [Saccharopolyspora antimicrobica]
MDTSLVTAIIRAGLTLLTQAVSDVTGDPGELRSKARDCAQCAQQVGAAARATNQVVTQLGETWNGRGYDACRQKSDGFVDQLTNVLKVALEKESQRLTAASDALVRARSTAQQQKADFLQKAMEIVQRMMDGIRAAQGMSSPWREVAIALAIMNAVMQATQLKSQSEASAEQNKNALSQTLTTLFADSGTPAAVAA